MSEFEPRQIVIAHEAIWNGMVRWAEAHNFELVRIPAGCDEEGHLTMDPGDDLSPYAFMPKA